MSYNYNQQEMLSKEHTSNVIRTWIYRGIGWCGTFIGFLLLTNLGMHLGKYCDTACTILGGICCSGRHPNYQGIGWLWLTDC